MQSTEFAIFARGYKLFKNLLPFTWHVLNVIVDHAPWIPTLQLSLSYGAYHTHSMSKPVKPFRDQFKKTMFQVRTTRAELTVTNAVLALTSYLGNLAAVGSTTLVKVH